MWRVRMATKTDETKVVSTHARIVNQGTILAVKLKMINQDRMIFGDFSANS